jgi:hypothetical protein
LGYDRQKFAHRLAPPVADPAATAFDTTKLSENCLMLMEPHTLARKICATESQKRYHYGHFYSLPFSFVTT